MVIGISTDNIKTQQQFSDKENLNFPLMADPTKEATRAFGALGPSGFASRYTYVIDGEGVVRKIYTKVSPATHPDEVLAFIKENLVK